MMFPFTAENQGTREIGHTTNGTLDFSLNQSLWYLPEIASPIVLLSAYSAGISTIDGNDRSPVHSNMHIVIYHVPIGM